MINKKNKIKLTFIMVLAILMVAAFASAGVNIFFSYSDYDYAPYQANFEFAYYDYDTILAPYGYWIRVEPIGIVWVPYVYVTWRPYYYGYWVFTSYGPTWVAYEPWGWLTHHYGRWFYYPVYGWCWMPGYQWAPAWVSWRIYGEYIAWAPLAPDGYYFDYDSRYNAYNRYNGYRQNPLKFNPYVAVNVKDFNKENIHKYIKNNIKFDELKFFSDRAPEKEYIEKHTYYKIPLIPLEAKTFRINEKEVKYFSPAGQAEKIVNHSEEINKILRPVKLNNERERKFIVKEGRLIRDDSNYHSKMDRESYYKAMEKNYPNINNGRKIENKNYEIYNWEENRKYDKPAINKYNSENYEKSDNYIREFFKEKSHHLEENKPSYYYERNQDKIYRRSPDKKIKDEINNYSKSDAIRSLERNNYSREPRQLFYKEQTIKIKKR